ncbi:MAG TPA: CHAD domain-containing protein [Verrucomicrobiae bacterium]|nr:CHAD domain-containing protein [Verrucomicrobiae bacterium]
MSRKRKAQPEDGASGQAPCDVVQHLAETLPAQCHCYKKRLKTCQRRFSEEAVHQSRTETRRLLGTIELLRAFIPGKRLKKTRRALKQHLDTFDELRDTQVQLDYMGRLKKSFPLTRKFRQWLARRESRLTRQTRRAVKDIRTKRLARSIACFEKDMKRLRRRIPPDVALRTALRAIDQAFARVASLCKRVTPNDTGSIHRTRIAFKRFRYMIEALLPLLPVVTEERRRAMRGYQSMMGDIQDAEILLSAFDRFVECEQVDGRSARPLRAELTRRRTWLIQVYLRAARKLGLFWPAGKGGGSIAGGG